MKSNNNRNPPAILHNCLPITTNIERINHFHEISWAKSCVLLLLLGYLLSVFLCLVFYISDEKVFLSVMNLYLIYNFFYLFIYLFSCCSELILSCEFEDVAKMVGVFFLGGRNKRLWKNKYLKCSFKVYLPRVYRIFPFFLHSFQL